MKKERPMADLARHAATFDQIRAEEKSPALVCAVIRDGKIADAHASGDRAVDPALPMKLWTKARVASISKLPVGIAANMLVERGLLDLNAPAEGVLGFPLRNPNFPNTTITLAHLLSHTSSLRDGEQYWGTLGETLAEFFQPGPSPRWENGGHYAKDFPPGAKFVYCNLASGVIASMIERASGKRFDLFMRDEVFAPLGLTCGYNWSQVPQEEVDTGATLYRWRDGAFQPGVDGPGKKISGPMFSNPGAVLAGYTPGLNGTLFGPQGGLRASILDVATIGCLVANGGVMNGARLYGGATAKRLAAPAWEDTSAAPGPDNYDGLMISQGLGAGHLLPQQVPHLKIPGRLVGHTAEAYGLFGAVFVDPVSRHGFAYYLTGSLPEPAKAALGPFNRAEDRIVQILAGAAFG
jgi:CubicO group peptidase (beta-lactamase class C family)